MICMSMSSLSDPKSPYMMREARQMYTYAAVEPTTDESN